MIPTCCGPLKSAAKVLQCLSNVFWTRRILSLLMMATTFLGRMRGCLSTDMTYLYLPIYILCDMNCELFAGLLVGEELLEHILG